MKRIFAALAIAAVAGITITAAAWDQVPVSTAFASTSYGGMVPGNALDTITANPGWMSWGNSQNEGKDDAPYIAFTFSKPYGLQEMNVWNFGGPATGGNNLRGLCQVEVITSPDGITFNNSLGIFTFDLAGGAPWSSDAPTAQTIALGGVVAQGVMLDIKTNWWGHYGYAAGVFDQGTSYEGTWANASIPGLNEVQFFRVPEPTSALLLGLGALALRRRRA